MPRAFIWNEEMTSDTFNQLSDFIRNRMRMSHIYQPVMLINLLSNQGSSTEEEIAKDILTHDESQIEYYVNVVKNMVGRVLRNHKIVSKDKKRFNLTGFEELSTEETENLITLCKDKLTEYIEKRGEKLWEYRKGTSAYISGTDKYEVLKRAKFRCELCGISAEEKALQVDHIIPRNKNGQNEMSNYQALCYSCNAMKRDRDDTDFRGMAESYKHREKDCLFCHMEKMRVIAENELAYVIEDKFPVTKYHRLIIPKRHVSSYFELYQPEINACRNLVLSSKEEIEKADSSVEGFNVGINVGECAGQTVFHCHIHLIPRRTGDVQDPRGGVRYVVPENGLYEV